MTRHGKYGQTTIMNACLLNFLHFIAVFERSKGEAAVTWAANIVYASANAYGAIAGKGVTGSSEDA